MFFGHAFDAVYVCERTKHEPQDGPQRIEAHRLFQGRAIRFIDVQSPLKAPGVFLNVPSMLYVRTNHETQDEPQSILARDVVCMCVRTKNTTQDDLE